jgi:hypothetical protein
MPHPKLISWLKTYQGHISFAVGKDGDVHLVTDAPGRRSLHDLMAIFASVEYESSISFSLCEPSYIEPSIQKREPRWCMKIKVAGCEASENILFILDEGCTVQAPRADLQKILSTPNFGHDEVFLRLSSKQRFGIW